MTPTYHEIFIAVFKSGKKIKRESRLSPSRVLEILCEPKEAPLYYTVDFLEEEGESRWSLGTFQVWFSGERAYLRLDEHREHYARDSKLEDDQWKSLNFVDESGEFNIDYIDTVSRIQVHEALVFWLSTGEKIESLSWS